MSDLSEAQVRGAVDAVLGRERLEVTPEDYERLLRDYPIMRQQLLELRLEEARYVEPAIVYSARSP